MWKMTHICHLPELILMEKDWQLLVAAGQQEIEEEEDGGNGNDGAKGDDEEEDEEVFDIEEINPTFYKHMETQFFGYPQPGLEGENQIQGQDRFGEGKEERKFESY
jgi:hypothetical protein